LQLVDGFKNDTATYIGVDDKYVFHNSAQRLMRLGLLKIFWVNLIIFFFCFQFKKTKQKTVITIKFSNLNIESVNAVKYGMASLTGKNSFNKLFSPFFSINILPLTQTTNENK